ncbi:hypothetical protein EW145_g5457 [Phellinidium pouzarii]|uniref:Uncharacterized protein n=1 Tax=Phellinidium pouzarii TaxID=167371 RepID=A0A4S4L047_9AGAM|nr:hypothetical protein EW145_g5457 [Phellinidium pouzarii]
MSSVTSTTTTTTVSTPRMSAGSLLSGAVPLAAYSPPSNSNASTTGTAVPSASSSASTLRSLYPRAARALLQRDVALTYSLLVSAFALLTPPESAVPGILDPHRRKWDILRITLETTVFATPPASADPEALPAPLRANLMLSAQGLIATLHARSVRLFTPQAQSPKAAYLPAQMLVVLVLSSLKLHCADAGRSIVEDWLAQRESVERVRNDAEGYLRVLELFCLHVLPRLHDWEYAEEFLGYERELTPQSRQSLQLSLKALRKQEIEEARSIPSPPPLSIPNSSTSSPQRFPSPALSTSSSSSTDTDDTHSTRTVVPHTPQRRNQNGTAGRTPTPSVSSSSLSDMKYTNGLGSAHDGHGKRSRSPVSPARAGSSTFRSRTGVNRVGSDLSPAAASQRAISARSSPSTLTLIKASLRPLFSRISASQFVFALLFVLVPILSFLLRRRRRRMAGAASDTGVDEVRRRLALRVSEPRAGVLGAMWWGLARAVADAVRMAGGGLV